MDTTNDKEFDNEQTINRVCEFLKLKTFNLTAITIQDKIKELCVAKLCEVVGLTGKYNYKSKFFDFFSSIMGQAVCNKLSLRLIIASDELRLFKYDHVNLVEEVNNLLNEKNIEEAFLDAFELVDKFKYLIK